MESQPKLDVQLLGAFRITYQGQLVRSVLTRRLVSLLAYLLIHRQESVSRQRLAFLFWPDTREEQARTNLRRLLHQLKTAFPPVERYILSDSTNLSWNLAVPCHLDVAAFEAAGLQAAGDINALQAACDLYTGDLLPDLYDDWITPERDRLRESYQNLLEQLSDQQEQENLFIPAIETARRLLRHDPSREETYLRLMRLHAKRGDRMGVRRAYLDCAAILRHELGVEPAPDTEKAYQQWIKPGAFPPTLPITAYTNRPARRSSNLPAFLDRLIGRQEELSRLKNMACGQRLVTLTGFGGVGKTRLALAAASELQGNFPDGAWWVDLASVSDPSLIPQVMVNSLGVPEVGGRPSDDLLVDFLIGKSLLLVLDNCEHLLVSVAQITGRLLRDCHKLHVLATSRVRLRLPGETIFPIDPLPVPETNDIALTNKKFAVRKRAAEETMGHSHIDSAKNPSVQLFVERAAAHEPAFSLNPQSLTAIVQICRRLDGIPLAIELAAGRARLLSPDGIAAHLVDAFKILADGEATLPRHQTLRATLDWSYSLLPAEGQTILNRLAVFAGRFSLEAAEEITGGDGIEKDDVFQLLARLVDHSLVAVENLEAGFYYRLHEVTRQYGLEMLKKEGELETNQERHLAYFTSLARQAEPFLYRREQLVWLRRLDLELTNLRSALDWSTRQKDSRQLERALDLANSLYFYWYFRSSFIEGLSWLERAIAAATELPISRSIICKAFDKAASFALFLGETGKAKSYSESFLNIWQELRDPYVGIIAFRHMGYTALILSGPEQAVLYFQEGLRKAQELGDEFNTVRLLNDLGKVAASRGDLEQAYQFHQQELEIARRTGERYNLIYAAGYLGKISLELGNLEEADHYLSESLNYSTELGHDLGAAFAIEYKGRLAFLNGGFDEALRLWRKSLAILWERQDLEQFLNVLESLANAFSILGELKKTTSLLATCYTARSKHNLKNLADFPQEIKSLLERLQRELNDEDFNQAWETGQQMTLEDAVRLALDET